LPLPEPILGEVVTVVIHQVSKDIRDSESPAGLRRRYGGGPVNWILVMIP